MRNLRTIVSAVLVAVMSLGGVALVSSPSHAATTAKPKRVITEADPRNDRVGPLTYRFTGQAKQPLADGTLAPYAKKKVQIQLKKCATCKWKTQKVLTTGTSGRYKTRIAIPRKGRWWWRSMIKADRTYATTFGRSWLVRLR